MKIDLLSLEYNPYTAKLQKLKNSLKNVEAKRKELIKALDEYEAFDRNATASEIAVADERILVLRTELAAVPSWRRPRLRTGLGRPTWMDVFKLIVQKGSDLDGQLEYETRRAEALRGELKAHRAFRRKDQQAKLKKLEAESLSISGQIDEIWPLYEAIDEPLRPLLADLKAAQAQRDEAAARASSAATFEKRLNAASSAEKRGIHQECEETLGESSPRKVRERSHGALEAVDREIEKIKRRLSIVAARLTRQVDLVVFDGNNLCYSGDQFVGLAPLEAVFRKLSGRMKLLFVFDESIRDLTRMKDRQIASTIGDGAKLHIVNGVADETILDLATGENAYVVSNDKFLDFRTKAPVQHRRVFRFENVNDRIMIHDLDVSEQYA